MNKYPKPPQTQVAFTLLELIVVVVLLAIISGYVFTKFSSSGGYRLDAAAESIIAAGQLTQQLSMNDSQRNFALVIQTSQINLLADGVTFTGSDDYPIQFDSSISITPTTTISFDSLGGTTDVTLSVTSGSSINVCFTGSGLIRRC